MLEYFNFNEMHLDQANDSKHRSMIMNHDLGRA